MIRIYNNKGCTMCKKQKVTSDFITFWMPSEHAPRGGCNCATRGMKIRPDADCATSGRTENCVGT